MAAYTAGPTGSGSTHTDRVISGGKKAAKKTMPAKKVAKKAMAETPVSGGPVAGQGLVPKTTKKVTVKSSKRKPTTMVPAEMSETVRGRQSTVITPRMARMQKR